MNQKITHIMNRYKQNLKVIGSEVFSYDTHVADVDHTEKLVIERGYWSVTTRKHVNYVGAEYGYKVVKYK